MRLPEDIVVEQMDAVIDLVRGRTERYNQGGVRLEDYWIFGNRSLVHEINKKILRVKSLVEQGKPESAKDSLQDIIAYSCFMLDYNEKKRGD